jgi:hypothetical protein
MADIDPGYKDHADAAVAVTQVTELHPEELVLSV